MTQNIGEVDDIKRYENEKYAGSPRIAAIDSLHLDLLARRRCRRLRRGRTRECETVSEPAQQQGDDDSLNGGVRPVIQAVLPGIEFIVADGESSQHEPGGHARRIADPHDRMQEAEQEQHKRQYGKYADSHLQPAGLKRLIADRFADSSIDKEKDQNGRYGDLADRCVHVRVSLLIFV